MSADPPKCHWENCTEEASVRMRWRRQAADGKNDAFDLANYCPAHSMMAAQQGAAHVLTLAVPKTALTRSDPPPRQQIRRR